MKLRLSKALALLLCLALWICVLPAAFAADEPAGPGWGNSADQAYQPQEAPTLSAREDNAFEAATDIYAELTAAIKAGQEGIDMDGKAFRISKSIEIPEDFTLHFYNGGRMSIPTGVTLTVRGSVVGSYIQLNGTVENYGRVQAGDGIGLGSAALFRFHNSSKLTAFGADPLDSRFSYANVDCDFEVQMDADSQEQLLQAKTKFENAPDAVYGNIHISFPWTLDQDVIFTDKVGLEVHGNEQEAYVRVPRGVTLEIHRARLQCADMIVEGTLINNRELTLDNSSRTPEVPTGSLRVEGGIYSGDGKITIRGIDNGDSRLVGLDLNRFTRYYESDAFAYYPREGGMTFADMVELSRNPGTYDITNPGRFTIERDFTVPENVWFNAFSGEVYVPHGVTLTVNGNMNINRLVVDGRLVTNNWVGTHGLFDFDDDVSRLTINSGFEIWDVAWTDALYSLQTTENTMIAVTASAENDAEMEQILSIHYDFPNEHFERLVVQAYQRNLYGSLEIPKQVTYQLPGHWDQYNDYNRPNLTVRPGATLKVEGEILCTDAVITVYGSVENEGVLHIYNDRHKLAHLGFVNNGSYSGSGEIWALNTPDPDGMLSGLNLNDFEILRKPEGATYALRNSGTEAENIYEELAAMIAEGRKELDFSKRGSLTLPESGSIVIPAGTIARFQGAHLTIPEGFNLIVEGELGDLILGEVQLDGRITSRNGGRASIQDKLDRGRNGHIYVNNAVSNFNIEANGLPDDALYVIQGDSRVNYNDWRVRSYNDLYALMDYVAPDERIAANAVIAFNMTVDSDLTIYTRNSLFSLAVSPRVNGYLTVAEGATLTMETFFSVDQGADLQVYGTLVNNYNLQIKDDSSVSLLGGRARYTGSGIITVKDIANPESHLHGFDMKRFVHKNQSDRIVYMFPEPDFRLPSSLRTIGAEAFCGAAFRYPLLPDGVKTIGKRAFADCPKLSYIYIPATVKSIDPTAFAGVSDLKILGAAGSYAESFAAQYGFHFIAD